MKRFLCVLICAFMMFNCVSLSAYAEENVTVADVLVGGQEVLPEEDGTYPLTFTLQNTSGSDMDFDIYIGGYNEHLELVVCYLQQFEVASGEASEFLQEVTLSEDVDKLRIFVWKNEIEPVMERVFEITARYSADMTDYYEKSQILNLFSDYLTKAEFNSYMDSIDIPDMSAYYTKSEADEMMSAESEAVKSRIVLLEEARKELESKLETLDMKVGGGENIQLGSGNILDLLGNAVSNINTITGHTLIAKTDKEITFNRVYFPCSVAGEDNDLNYRIYISDEALHGGSNMYLSEAVLAASGTIKGDKLNTDTTSMQIIDVGADITIDENKYIYIGCELKQPETNKYKYRTWKADESGYDEEKAAMYYYSYGTLGFDTSLLIGEGQNHGTAFRLTYASPKTSGEVVDFEIEDNSISYKKLVDNRLYDIALPSVVYMSADGEMNIYWQYLVGDSPEKHYFKANGTIGRNYADCYRISKPSVGEHSVVFEVYNERMELEMSKEVTFIVVERTDAVQNVAVIGDSIIANGNHSGSVTFYAKNELGNNVNMLGKFGTENAEHNGIGGCTVSELAASAVSNGKTNYFYNEGSFDFANWMSTNAYEDCDQVYIHLGINDVFSSKDINSLWIKNSSHIDSIINSIHSYNPDIKIVLLTPTGAPVGDDLGNVYGNGFSQWVFKKNLHEYSCNMIETYEGRENENIYVLLFGGSIDPDKGYITNEVTVFEASQYKETLHNDIHPNEDGYKQLAYSLVNYIVGLSE